MEVIPVTLDEMIEWSEISATVSHVVNALEECTICKRLTECDRLRYVDGYYCDVCIGQFLSIEGPQQAACHLQSLSTTADHRERAEVANDPRPEERA
jgi:hypothetical protein